MQHRLSVAVAERTWDVSRTAPPDPHVASRVRNMPSYPAHLLTDDESVVVELRPHWRVLLVPLLVVVVVAAVLVVVAGIDARPSWALPAVGLLGLVLVAGLAVPPVLTRLFTLYVLTTERIVVRTGVVSRSSKEIPVESISNVVFTQQVVERMLGYGDVLLESSGETSATRLQDVPDPEVFQSRVYAVREQRSLQLGSGVASAGPRDTASQLSELADLHDRGKLTDEEFAAQKARLLDGA
jgi:uncharacterized membrane protein YdbT with pleckstrin-like domain